jgi:acetylornithine deacetylase/succinyl-diaminopimelate desuccinylase-like protein
MTQRLDQEKLNKYIKSFQDTEMNKMFTEFGKKKVESPIYNPNWEKDGDLLNTLKSLSTWIKSQITIVNDDFINNKGQTPLYYFNIEPTDPEDNYTILFYSHIDKVPFGSDWKKINPENPQLIDSHFYGRGIANGFSTIFAFISAIKGIKNQNFKIPNINVIIETGFESGSVDLANHINQIYKGYIFNMIISLDSESPVNNYFHFINTMKGSLIIDTKVQTVKRSVHSGTFGGFIPDPFLIFQSIFNNIENIKDNEIDIPCLHIDITDEQKNEAKKVIDKIGNFYNKFDKIKNVILIGGNDGVKNYLYGTLLPCVNIIGCDNVPNVGFGGGIINPYFTFRLDFGVPHILNIKEAYDKVNNVIIKNPPFNASVENKLVDCVQGCDLNISDKIWEEINFHSKEIFKDDAFKFGLSKPIRGLQILKNLHNDTPIICTGFSELFNSNNRKGDENIDINYLNLVSCELAHIIAGYKNY